VKNTRHPRVSLQPLENGQVWQMDDSRLRVELVGKMLVHYKLGKVTDKRMSTSLSNKKDLEKFLTQNKAVLISE
jgi:hypothetical protein